MFPAWVMIFCMSRTFSHNSNWSTMVSTTKLSFLWLDVFTFLCNKLNFIVFLFTWEESSQILESLGRKWNTLERNGLATVVTWLTQTFHNSNFSYLKLFWWSLALPSYPSFTVYIYIYIYVHLLWSYPSLSYLYSLQSYLPLIDLYLLWSYPLLIYLYSLYICRA